MARSGEAGAVASAEELLLPPTADAEGSHRRVLEAALVCFGERGFHGVTVREIANRAGIHVSSMYWHVPSKEALLYELCLLGHQFHADRYSQALAAAAPDPFARFVALADSHIRTHITYRMLGRVSNRELPALSPEHHQHIQTYRNRRSVLEEIIAAGVREGVFEAGDIWLAASTVLGLGHRVAEWWTPQLGLPADGVVEGLVEHALRVVGARRR